MPRTVKLVVLGSSGVGKTSLRGKYLAGRFSSGYRATIGADFITKTLCHPTDPTQSIILQIWDTAGQERFSSLSRAYFRGADAALLMFDVNAPDSMHALRKWWDEFRDQAPVADEDINDYCCVVVGNKIDTIVSGENPGLVTKSDALAFLDELLPPSHVSTSLTFHESSSPSPSSQVQIHSNSVDIHPPNHISHRLSPSFKLTPSHSHLSPHLYTGTMTSTSTTFTVYHTPSSSFYHSARSSPEPSSLSEPSSSFRQRKRLSRSSTSTGSGSEATITPNIYAHENGSLSNTDTSDNLVTTITTSSSPSHPRPVLPPLERGPKLFFTSAKTGEGVADVFEYIAYRVSRKWEHEERMEARQTHHDPITAETIHLGLDNGIAGSDLVVRHGRGRWGNCCS